VQSIADKMFEAPFLLLAHDRCQEGVANEDAVFTYANQVRSRPYPWRLSKRSIQCCSCAAWRAAQAYSGAQWQTS
jgi:hypothetical protein